MIPKGMDYADANAKLQEINQSVIDMVSKIPNAPGEDVTNGTKKLWTAYCTGGEEALKKEMKALSETCTEIKKAHDKIAEMTEKLAGAKSQVGAMSAAKAEAK